MDKTQLAVIGGGPAGASAAIEAARAGVEVNLIDENPMDFAMMGLDIPFLFGQRMTPALRDKGAMLQRVVSSSELLATAQDEGVHLLLGTYAWGSFRNQENSIRLERPVLGLADGEHSWMLEYDQLVLATGARDLVLAFPGRNLVGVMGANGAMLLMSRYQGLSAGKIAVLGSGDLGLFTATRALDHGLEVVGIVDVSPDVRGDPGLRAGLENRGVPFYTSHTIKEARGYREVESIVISRIDGGLQPVDGSDQMLECDTVCLAMGLVPSVELPYLSGCDLSFRPELGGFVPDRDQDLRTSMANVYVAGDTAGFREGMITDVAIATDQGKLAGITASESLGVIDKDRAAALREGLAQSAYAPDKDSTGEYRLSWLTSLVGAGGLDVNVCECEEVTRGEVIHVTPPRYLGYEGGESGRKAMEAVLEEGDVDLDQLKRLTRAGMGFCQGRRCREEIAMLVAHSKGMDVASIPLASYRPPVRPLPLKIMWPHDEPEEVRKSWAYWFKMPKERIEELEKHR
ncbi:MAG: NAD(P)/FAD-dependent oxidoreductase [Dehalococcoidia bacterium]